MSSFELDLQKLCGKAKDKMDLVVKKIVFDLGRKVVERSPVGDGSYWKSPPPKGYVGGRFRGNWQHGEGALPKATFDTIDPSGEASIARINTSMASAPVAGHHYIVNNLPYAQRIENGWSRQAPQGIVHLSVMEFKNVVQAAVRSSK